MDVHSLSQRALILALLAAAACNDSEPGTTSLTALTSLAGPSPSSFDDGADPSGDPSGDPTGNIPTEADTTVDPTEGTQSTPGDTSSPTTVSTSGPSSDPSSDPDTTSPTTVPPDTGDEGCVPCQDFMQSAAPNPANVMLVLDKSGSMTADPGGYWDHDGNPNTAEVTRWKSLHAVIAAITQAQGGAYNFGALLYPSKTATSDYSLSACPVGGAPDVAIGPDKGPAIIAAIPSADASVKGGQPMAAAVATAHAALAAASGPGAIILVGDSAANCQNSGDTKIIFETYDENVVDAVAEAYADGYPVHVVGIEIDDVTSNATKDGIPDNTNTFSRYNELALVGGRPKNGTEKFHNCDDQAELQTAYEAILADTRDCTIDLEQEPADPGALEVTVDGATIPMVADCAGQTAGWAWTVPYAQIELCGQTCSNFAAAGQADLFADCGC